MRAAWCTPPGEAALAVLQVRGSARQLASLVHGPLPDPGGVALRTVPGIDEAVTLRLDDRTLMLTPHGGPRIRQLLTDRLRALGASVEAAPADLWCTATANAVTRRVLASLPYAASGEAVPLLLAQPERWRRHGPPGPEDAARGLRLRRLLRAPVIALVGPPNAGKSSLLNALAGHEAAATSPEPGTTRDFVTAPATLAGLACTLLDAPGVRQAADPLEREAVASARRAVAAADLRVSLADPSQPFLDEWPHALRVRTKQDERRAGDAPQVSARTGQGLAWLAATLREALVPAADLADERPFDFDVP